MYKMKSLVETIIVSVAIILVILLIIIIVCLTCLPSINKVGSTRVTDTFLTQSPPCTGPPYDRLPPPPVTPCQTACSQVDVNDVAALETCYRNCETCADPCLTSYNNTLCSVKCRNPVTGQSECTIATGDAYLTCVANLPCSKTTDVYVGELKSDPSQTRNSDPGPLSKQTVPCYVTLPPPPETSCQTNCSKNHPTDADCLPNCASCALPCAKSYGSTQCKCSGDAANQNPCVIEASEIYTACANQSCSGQDV
jgi:hypothetical protein